VEVRVARTTRFGDRVQHKRNSYYLNAQNEQSFGNYALCNALPRGTFCCDQSAQHKPPFSDGIPQSSANPSSDVDASQVSNRANKALCNWITRHAA
jgi:hypothetical protein